MCATDCTGHSEHVAGPGVDVIKSGELAPIDDGPGALAPMVEPGNIAGSLVRMLQGWTLRAIEANALQEKISQHWSWKATAREFLDQLDDQTEEAP